MNTHPHFDFRVLFSVVACVCLAGAGGCASYATPGRGADLSVLGADTAAARNAQTDVSLETTLNKKPLAQLPASIAVVRIESPGYKSESTQGWGTGRFSIVTTRDIEDPKIIEKWESMPMVMGIAPINRLLLPADLQSDLDLRKAAASLHADFVLAYTIDTVFKDNDMAVALTVVTLGLAPDHKTQVMSTASAVLLDTRNGYIYGVAEATADDSGLATGWNTTSQIDGLCKKAESEAFEKLGGQVEMMWGKVVKGYATAAAASVLTETQIAAIDPRMRDYLDQREAAQAKIAELSAYGMMPKNPAMIDANTKLDVLNAMIGKYVDTYNSTHHASAVQPAAIDVK